MSRKKREQITGLLLLAGVICLVAAAGIFIKYKLDAKRAQEQMEVLHNQLELDQAKQEAQEGLGEEIEPQEQSSTDSTTGDGENKGGSALADTPETEGGPQAAATDSSEAPAEPVRVQNPYKESFLANDDMVAWLKIEGTNIDYPVMQTMEDENYYLRRGFDKKSNTAGCLILDTDSTITEPLSTNQIIHGHNMSNGTMFARLVDYEDPEFCEEHKYMKLYTEECERNYEVIAVFRSQVFRKKDEVFKFYKFFQADTQEEFDDWYTNIKAMSEFDTGVTAEFGDRFLTLSTCVYHVENGRLVVVAKEIEPGDYYEPIEAAQ